MMKEYMVGFAWQDNLSEQIWRNGWIVRARSGDSALKKGLKELDDLVARVSNTGKFRLAIVVKDKWASEWPQ